MKGRPAIYDNDAVILKAQEVFWEKGYSATSLQDLQAATQMGSGSLYNTFRGGKKELFSKALQQRREAFLAFKRELKEHASPVDLIKDFFRSLAEADEHTHLKGCIVANTVTALAFVDQDLETEAISILKDVERMFTETVREAQKSGSITNPADAAVLGRYLVTCWNGLNVTRRMHPNKEKLKELIEVQLSILQ
ncbi:TetR family transcriptional regulator C-terminal domain-containing protein [Chitinophaga oryzae]|uniref:TetR family transcriptional regulator C-terminal domain-containing protein n=1 Tax=Chitinophaga oryzae TaxID=2725414 RepID=A0AAE6ZEX9_9BACT|nr:TetR/AcrR family transcriptional regulator [Chitinophaga oryzae]QJB31405.1 TetR family transcriptional regulator C-terminal domain-containing protein [Chitinophaga oryzae]QJB37889.1 TetR family transcriptional regulator C-terminal domain-containing protein [Chitinophaga oryzae]